MPHNTRDLIASFYKDAIAADELPSDVNVLTTATKLLNYNSKRMHVYISNNGDANVWVEREASVSVTTGIPIGPGQSLELDWAEDVDLVTRQLYAITNFGPCACHVLETIITGTDTGG